MTPEQLEAQSLESIAAWCKDQSVQLECSVKSDKNKNWVAKVGNTFYLDSTYYRIVKPRKWYRVAKMRDVIDIEPYTVHVTSEVDEDLLESDREFIEWLDERKYYD